MNNFFSEFMKVSQDEWEKKITAELKGSDSSILHNVDSIEEIDFHTFYHSDTTKFAHESPGDFPFTRGMFRKDNRWFNGALVHVSDEVKANNKALQKLITGADLLVFQSEKENIDWREVFNDIQFEHIHVQFNIKTISEYIAIHNTFVHGEIKNVQFNFDLLSNELSNEDVTRLIEKNVTDQVRIFDVNGFNLQKCGATSWQEVGFCLNVAHEYLLKLMGMGLTIDQASAWIGFTVGIGSNYFYEIAKIRALRHGWSKIIAAYDPEHNCTFNASITAVIGHMNKSLKDPYTNLLRQTTEVMSALNAGVTSILVLPYDLYSEDGATELAERMALNIPLILKEESHLDVVIDPMGGSYSIEVLTKIIGDKAWDFFKKLEEKGGLFNHEAKDYLKQEIEHKQNHRIQSLLKGETVVLGINKYPDPKQRDGVWKAMDQYLNINPFVLELAHEKAAV